MKPKLVKANFKFKSRPKKNVPGFVISTSLGLLPNICTRLQSTNTDWAMVWPTCPKLRGSISAFHTSGVVLQRSLINQYDLSFLVLYSFGLNFLLIIKTWPKSTLNMSFLPSNWSWGFWLFELETKSNRKSSDVHSCMLVSVPIIVCVCVSLCAHLCLFARTNTHSGIMIMPRLRTEPSLPASGFAACSDFRHSSIYLSDLEPSEAVSSLYAFKHTSTSCRINNMRV